MTEQQIEAAARLLCEKRGIDPDEIVPYESGNFPFFLKKCEWWKLIAPEIRAHHEVLTSIATVMDMEGE